MTRDDEILVCPCVKPDNEAASYSLSVDNVMEDPHDPDTFRPARIHVSLLALYDSDQEPVQCFWMSTDDARKLVHHLQHAIELRDAREGCD